MQARRSAAPSLAAPAPLPPCDNRFVLFGVRQGQTTCFATVTQDSGPILVCKSIVQRTVSQVWQHEVVFTPVLRLSRRHHAQYMIALLTTVAKQRCCYSACSSVAIHGNWFYRLLEVMYDTKCEGRHARQAGRAL